MIVLENPHFHERIFPVIRAALGKRGGIERENASKVFRARFLSNIHAASLPVKSDNVGNVFPKMPAKLEDNHSIDKERGETQSNSAIFFFTFYEIFL